MKTRNIILQANLQMSYPCLRAGNYMFFGCIYFLSKWFKDIEGYTQQENNDCSAGTYLAEHITLFGTCLLKVHGDKIR